MIFKRMEKLNHQDFLELEEQMQMLTISSQLLSSGDYQQKDTILQESIKVWLFFKNKNVQADQLVLFEQAILQFCKS